MYITNRPEVALIAEQAGVDWIFLDMEFIGKDTRQMGLDSVKNHHTIEDILRIKKVVSKSKILVRVNPIHKELNGYPSSEEEINEVIAAGADIVMLPYFKTVTEVRQFIKYVGKRAAVCLLLETAEASVLIDEILVLPGIDMIHIGLNDLHLELGMKFMFQLLSDGIVEQLGNKIKAKGIPFGFGGIARLDSGVLPGADVLKEHVRLGSSMVIISRSFCDTNKVGNLVEIRKLFTEGITAIRELEYEAEEAANYFVKNQREVQNAVSEIVEMIEKKSN